MTKDRRARRVAWFWKATPGVKGVHNVRVSADLTWRDAWPFDTDVPVSQPLDFGWGDKGTTGEISQSCIDRHNGWTNFAFLDCSVRHVGLKGLWTLKWHRNFNPAGKHTTAGGMPPSEWPLRLRKCEDY